MGMQTGAGGLQVAPTRGRASTSVGRKVEPGIIWWLLAMTSLVGLRSFIPGLENVTLVALAVAGLAHAVVAFWRSGGNTITATGVYMLASGVFVYFPALYTHFAFDRYDVSNGFTVLVFMTFSQVVFYYWSWQPHQPVPWMPACPAAPSASTFAFGVGVTLLVAGVVAGRVLGLGATTLAGAAAFTGVILIAVGLLQAGNRPSAFRMFVVLVAFGFYVESMFNGGGRLVLGGLAVALALVVSQRAGSRWVKLSALVALPVGLLLLAENRADLVASTRGAAETGLESVVSPYARLGQLIELAQNGDVPYVFGKTLVATAVLFVPRSLWPDKPVGFGAELGDFFRPDLIGTGYSEAALFPGEWIFNIGLVGLFVMLPVTAWLITRADHWQYQSHMKPTATRHDVFVRAGVVLVSAGVLDLFWGGTFLFAARGGQRLLVLLVVYVLFAWGSRQTAARERAKEIRARRRFVSFR